MNKRIPIATAALLGLALALAVNAAEKSPAPQAAEAAGKAVKNEKEPAKEPAGDKRAQHEERGDEHLMRNRFQEAIKEFDAAIAADPEVGALYVKKSIALYRSGKPLDALPLLDKALQLNKGDKTGDWLPLYHKAMALGVSGDLEGSMKNFNESIKLKPGADNLSGRAIAYARQDKPEQALADVYMALRYRPNHVPLRDLAEKLETQIKTEEEAAKFLKEMAAKEGAQKTDSGLIYFELKQGSGKSPSAKDTVKVNYHGVLPSGQVFDSSVNRGEPITFPLNKVIPCWTEGLQKMQVGGKAMLVCPAELAYGNKGAGFWVNPGAALVFEVELLGIE